MFFFACLSTGSKKGLYLSTTLPLLQLNYYISKKIENLEKNIYLLEGFQYIYLGLKIR